MQTCVKILQDITVKSVAPSKNVIVGKPATKGKVASISSDDSDSDSEDHDVSLLVAS